jgi:protein O-GlcNAc transferase
MSAAEKFKQALASLQQGQTAATMALCREVLRHQPDHADALHLLGVISLQNGDGPGGIELLRRSIRINPAQAFAHCNLGNALRDIQKPKAALASYGIALQLMPNFAGAFYGRGNALMDLKRNAEALESFDRAIALQPDYAEAFNNRGNALSGLGHRERALESYRQAAKRADFVLASRNCADMLFELKRFDEAVVFYDRVIGGDADMRAQCNRGHCLMALARPAEALDSFDAALALDPDSVEVLYARGMAQRVLKQHAKALADFERAAALTPDSADILYRRAEALRDLRRVEEAAVCFQRVLALTPERDFALGNLHHARLQLCDWTDYHATVARLVGAVEAGHRACFPGQFLSVVDSAAAQHRCASLAEHGQGDPARGTPARGLTALWRGERYAHDKIRVAYISADFREHPVSVLLVGVLEHHDRERFEIIGVSLSPPDESPLGERVTRAFDRVVDVSRLSDAAAAALLRTLEIDIAVDLMGLSGSSRPAIYGYRPAPAQVCYLGYTATTALPGMDYIIGDTVVIPSRDEAHYTERVIYLPDCYQPSDSRRAIGVAEVDPPSREQCGLPSGFVFCCFNSHYKITPDVFALWMRLLHAVPGSVLWLSDGTPAATDHLRRAAAEAHLSERLIFAPRLENAAAHLARYGLADLFLDTLPFNAHATASDALWAGLPVLTCQGGAFAGRVASSLLLAVGLPELVTNFLEEYEATARSLALEPARLVALRARLLRNRDTHPLFDTARYCRHLESAFASVRERSERGEAPASITVPAAETEPLAISEHVEI